MTWIPWSGLLISLAATIILSFFHFFGPWGMKYWEKDGHWFRSFAGGVAVAFVFLHMLPELVEQKEPIGNLLARVHWLTPLGDLAIFIAALVGFLIYYGLEILAERQSESSANNVYWLHLATFCLYNFLITYTMTLRVVTGIFFSVIFVIAMSLHFIILDKKFTTLYPKQFNHTGRLILVGALFVGWILSVVFDPVNVVVVAIMTAFLAGSVLLSVFREELPSAKKTSYLAFVIGSGVIMITLLTQAFVA